MRPCNKNKEDICAKEGKGIPIVKGRAGEVCELRTIKKRVHQTLEVISNGISVFCKKKRWKKVYGTEL